MVRILGAQVIERSVSCSEASALTDRWRRRTILVLKEATVFFLQQEEMVKRGFICTAEPWLSAVSPMCSVVRLLTVQVAPGNELLF